MGPFQSSRSLRSHCKARSVEAVVQAHTLVSQPSFLLGRLFNSWSGNLLSSFLQQQQIRAHFHIAFHVLLPKLLFCIAQEGPVGLPGLAQCQTGTRWISNVLWNDWDELRWKSGPPPQTSELLGILGCLQIHTYGVTRQWGKGKQMGHSLQGQQ